MNGNNNGIRFRGGYFEEMISIRKAPTTALGVY